MNKDVVVHHDVHLMHMSASPSQYKSCAAEGLILVFLQFHKPLALDEAVPGAVEERRKHDSDWHFLRWGDGGDVGGSDLA